MTGLWIILGLIGLALALELGARIYHRRYYGIPFHSKAIGEYPYNSFIEKVDPPLHYRFKKNFHSPLVNINRFRCRGPEPAPDGEKKRLLVIGESNFFGARLRREKELWSVKLQKMLDARAPGKWEVLNAGNPTYNSFQHRRLWEEELHRIKPDILVVALGGNDVSQAWMMGGKWTPGVPWPWEFIMALERKSPWWNRLLSRFCFYFLMRRRMTERKAFPRLDPDFKWEACLEAVAENYRAIVEDARRRGIKVASAPYAPAYDLEVSPEDGRKLEAIQSNWRTFVEGRGQYDYGFIDTLRGKWSRELEMPCIDMASAFKNHPKHYELYLDLVHWNAAGMSVVAETLYQTIDRLGWWE